MGEGGHIVVSKGVKGCLWGQRKERTTLTLLRELQRKTMHESRTEGSWERKRTSKATVNDARYKVKVKVIIKVNIKLKLKLK